MIKIKRFPKQSCLESFFARDCDHSKRMPRRDVSLLKPLVSFPRLISQSHCRKLPFQRLGLMGVGWAFPDYTERKRGKGEGLLYMWWNIFSCNWRDKLSLTVLTVQKRFYHISSTHGSFLLISAGLQGGTGGAAPWVRGECGIATGGREVGGQTGAAAQSHPANFALKCPRCWTSGQVGGSPLQSCARRNAHGRINERDWTQEEPVVGTLEPHRTRPPLHLPFLSCV